MWKFLTQMNEKSAGKISPSLNTRVVWSLIAAFTLADVIGLMAEGMSVDPMAFAGIAARMAFLLGLSFVYTRYRPDVRIASLAHTMAAALSSIVAVGIFSYLTVIWSRPLVDEYLVAFDQALGFDWPATYNWVKERPLAYAGLTIAYCTILPQMIVLIFVLNFFGRIARCWEMLWLYLLACILTMPFSILWPAVGAYGYFHVQSTEPYVNIFMALRNGTFKTFGSDPILGVIQFPSLHAAAAIIFPYVVRGSRMFIPFLLLNVLMLAATPFIGGHHFADVWGGIVLAGVTILIVRKIFAAGYAERLGPVK